MNVIGKDGEAVITGQGPKAPLLQAKPQEPVRVDVRGWFTGGNEVLLVYNDTEYRLRVTSNGKLILTK